MCPQYGLHADYESDSTLWDVIKYLFDSFSSYNLIALGKSGLLPILGRELHALTQ